MKMFMILLFLILSPSTHAENMIFGKVELINDDGIKVKDASNLVVFIEDIKGEFKAPVAHASIASKNKEFFPSLLAILKGTTVDFPNGDLIMHNVFSLSKTNPFDLGLYENGPGKSFQFVNSGLVKIYCNIHEKMIANILILENPYFSITEENGAFKIIDVPSGNHKISVWNKYGQTASRDIFLNGKDEIKIGLKVVKGKEVEVEMKQINISIKHKNKWGQDYKAKY